MAAHTVLVVDQTAPGAVATATEHVLASGMFLADSAGVQWTNQPAAVTELFGLTAHRVAATLTNCTVIRFFANCTDAGVAGTKLGLQYSIDSGATWVWMDGTVGTSTAGTPAVAGDATGLKVSSWVSIVAEARAAVWLRPVGHSGNGTADPDYNCIGFEAAEA